jgi:hypothetical protein
MPYRQPSRVCDLLITTRVWNELYLITRDSIYSYYFLLKKKEKI